MRLRTWLCWFWVIYGWRWLSRGVCHLKQAEGDRDGEDTSVRENREDCNYFMGMYSVIVEGRFCSPSTCSWQLMFPPAPANMTHYKCTHKAVFSQVAHFATLPKGKKIPSFKAAWKVMNLLFTQLVVNCDSSLRHQMVTGQFLAHLKRKRRCNAKKICLSLRCPLFGARMGPCLLCPSHLGLSTFHFQPSLFS